MPPDDRQPLIYAGIDEAGYGPRVGPLCVGLSVFRVNDWREGAPAPDLWDRLTGAVGRTASDSARGMVAVNDSKRLKLSNASTARHPLMHLERGVLSFLGALSRRPATDAALYDCLSTSLEPHPWYAGEPLACPVSTTAEHLAVTANALASALDARGVIPLDLRCEAVCETGFNRGVREYGSKAAVSFAAVGRFLRQIWEQWGSHAPRVVIDRQGGRRAYAGLLSEIFPECRIEVMAESMNISSYQIVEDAQPGCSPRRMFIRFEVDADSAHFPTALASMSAKLVRECAMLRFNRYWSDRIPELKPTAGYGVDARRWLEQTRAAISADERRALVRTA